MRSFVLDLTSGAGNGLYLGSRAQRRLVPDDDRQCNDQLALLFFLTFAASGPTVIEQREWAETWQG